jgi:hypothetical protein
VAYFVTPSAGLGCDVSSHRNAQLGPDYKGVVRGGASLKQELQRIPCRQEIALGDVEGARRISGGISARRYNGSGGDHRLGLSW